MASTEELVKVSRRVLSDCFLRNGAVVAGNSRKKYYPAQAKDYRFVWPRDAGYLLMAADILGLEFTDRFVNWCLKAEGVRETGLFFEKYHVSGRRAKHNFQPDQNGLLLIALHDLFMAGEELTDEAKKLTLLLADGLCRVWSDDCFSLVTQDLWEERHCFPDLKENFSYSLAVCARGLECASEMLGEKKWMKTGGKMKNVLASSPGGHYPRSFGEMVDERVDASLLGLLWPAQAVDACDKRFQRTVELIEERLVSDGGIYRYEGDEYDGWMGPGGVHRKKGAGYWPLLNFWMSVVKKQMGEEDAAMMYYNKVLDDLDDSLLIPEQVYGNSIQVSVKPLAWSHAMFVIASRYLGFA